MSNNNLYNLPSTWSLVKLGDVVENFKRGPFGSTIKKSFFVPEGYKVYEQKNAIYNSIELGNYFIDEKKFQELKDFELNPGDFIISCSGTIGKIYKLPKNAPKGVINQALLRIRLKEKKIVVEYFLELFKSQWFQRKMLVETRGSAMLNIAGVKELKQIPIPLPPLSEQKKIVKKIGKLFTELEGGVASLKKSKKQIKLYRQSVLTTAFSGRLVEVGADLISRDKSRLVPTTTDEQTGNDSLRDRQAVGKNEHLPYKQGVKKAAEPKITYEDNRLPKGWKWVKLGEVCKTTSGGTPSRKNPKYYEGKIPWIKSGELNFNIIIDAEEKITNEAIENSSAKIVPQGTLLIALYGATVGRLAFLGIEAATNQAVAAIFTPENLSNKFLYWFLFSYRNQLLKQRIGGAQPNISQNTIKNITIPFPSLSGQKKIVEEIEKRFSEADNIEKAIDDSLSKAEILRQSILKNAFEGRLV